MYMYVREQGKGVCHVCLCVCLGQIPMGPLMEGLECHMSIQILCRVVSSSVNMSWRYVACYFKKWPFLHVKFKSQGPHVWGSKDSPASPLRPRKLKSSVEVSLPTKIG